MKIKQFKELVDKIYETNPEADVYIEDREALYEVENVSLDEDGDLVIDPF